MMKEQKEKEKEKEKFHAGLSLLCLWLESGLDLSLRSKS